MSSKYWLTMKINIKIRRKAIKRMLSRYEKLQSRISPYGHDAEDIMKYYYLIEYWEENLNNITK